VDARSDEARDPDEMRDLDELVAEIRREFCDGLPLRVETMRFALEQLAGGYDADAAEAFYRAAHTLKGTAASFEAEELVGPAAALSDIGMRWFEGGGLDPSEMPAALEELERLREAVRSYSARMEDDAAG
jgi:HPt (histidine-containing phosphotransfer) domain-containing protein